MKEFMIQITGTPMGKGRARSFITRKGKVGHYAHENTRQWEKRASQCAKYQRPVKKALIKPVKISIKAYFKIPKSWPKWKKDLALEGKIAHVAKPDCDNVSKIVLDAFNEIVWVDDKQVCDCQVIKFYDKKPRVDCYISEILQIPSTIKTKADILNYNLFEN